MGSISELEATVALIRFLKSEIPPLYGEELAAVRMQVYEARLHSGREVYWVLGVLDHNPVPMFIAGAHNAHEASLLYAHAVETMLDRGILQ